MAATDLAFERVLKPLTRAMQQKQRDSVARRYAAMIRELRFIHDSNSDNLVLLQRHDWTEERLCVLFVLNSFYQEYLGPLHASAHGNALNLGTTIPIMHGTIAFDAKHRANVLSAVKDFHDLVLAANFRVPWLWANTCGDLIYWIAQEIREERRQNGGEHGEDIF